MYESFYGLTQKPFSIVPDPRLIYWGRMHRMAYAMLEFGVLNHAGYTVITGEIGSGKTTLVRHLLSKVDRQITTALITNTPQGRDELLRWIVMAFKQPTEGDYLTVFKRFEDFLRRQSAERRRTILIVDEAQNLGLDVLEELRMLSNLNIDDQQSFQLMLVGQPQLKDQLRDPRLEQFAQRVSVDFHLKALDEGEVRNYIDHRLKAVGSKDQIFSDEACMLIARASRGIPRLINTLCDTALVYGFAAEAKAITAGLVEEVIADKQNFGVFSVSA